MMTELLSMISEIGFGKWDESFGNTIDEVNESENRLNLTLPEPLKDYYITLGKHDEFMDADYHVYPLSDLIIKDDALVFCEENQGLAEWGIQLININLPNPQVSGRNAGRTRWVHQSLQTTSYLINLACWQAVMAQAEVAQCSLKKSELHIIENHFEYIGNIDVRSGDDGRSFVDKDNKILAVFRYLPELLYVGTSQEGALDALEERSGLVFDWL
jgi:hypothetical protein